MFKVKLYGNKGYTCQVLRIGQGLVGLGNNVAVGDDYDFVFSNNFDYADRDVQHKDSALSQKGFKVFNVLDIPPHLPSFPIDKLKDQLAQADLVTCISPPVKEQLEKIGVDSHVIWNPIKDVFFDPQVERGINCLYVGRHEDPNKRFNLLEGIYKYIIGPQGSFASGKYVGSVSDVVLNQFYNSAKIVALPSKFEGLGLTVLEAMAAGAIPLVCSDNPNSTLCPDFCVAEPTVESVNETYNRLLNNFTHYQSVILREWSFGVQIRFSKFAVAQNIINLYEKYKAK
jgi:hypothetical protein